ncbi:Cullin family-domain-containing protein [Pilobolus umbonatus]|nr:Cullin family-domain-containing protein [Pilobolus umbonatus]
MSNYNSIKRPRLENDASRSYQLPFSNLLSNSIMRDKRNPIVSDKKLIVYDLKVERPPLPVDYEKNAWERLKLAIYAVFEQQPSPESLEVLYLLCENLCQYDKSEELVASLQHEFRIHVERQFRLLSNEGVEGSEYLEKVYNLYNGYSKQINQIRCIFLYLDRTYVATLPKIGSIWNISLMLFREQYMMSHDVRQKLIRNMLDVFRRKRVGELLDDGPLQSCVRMLIELNLYTSEFEQQFLEESRLFYMTEGDELIESIDMSAYLRHASTRIHECNIFLSRKFIDKSTKAPLESITREELLIKRMEHILDKCFSYFMEDKCLDDLSMLFRLLQNVATSEVYAKYFTSYIKSRGTSILREKLKVQEKMNLLTKFICHADDVVDHSFEGNETFHKGLKDGIQYFINLKANRVPSLLAKYLDIVLKDEKLDDEAIDQAMIVFGNLQSKDEFEIIYKRDLAKRLLLGETNRNGERIMLNRMKKECGGAYTSKLEGMLKDIKLSNDMLDEFNELHQDDHLSPELQVNVLTHGFWPSYIPLNVNLPSNFLNLQALYTEFYMGKYPKRRLTWQNSLSTCEVSAHYPLGMKKITLTLLQTVILLLFNNEKRKSYSFEDILEYTQLDEVEVRRTLTSLACRDYKLITKHPNNLDIKMTDMFSYNHQFTSPEDSLKMTTATIKEVIEKNSSINKLVLLGREYQLDAVIMRIMKSKLKSSHGTLLSEVMSQARFPVTTQDIKKRLETLIERQYLERGMDETYTYLS